MDRYLSENSILKTDSGSYTIQKLIGTGSSCAVYFARRTEGNSGAVTEHIIKEYNPSFMALVRDEDGTLVPANDTDSAAQRFEQGRERFLEACRRQAELRSEHEALKNSTVNLQHTFDANGTCYADSTSFNGCTYDAVQEKSLHDMLRRFRAIAKIVGEYHKVGYLHLDIKPENILALNDTKELVMMFDFDSVVPMSEINGTAMLSCSRSWAAPELERGDRGSICPATDLYALGEMLFERIMGRHSSFMEHRSFSKFSFDSRSELFRNIDPRVFALLTDVFRKTLNSSPARRYSSADELIEVLDKLITLTRPETQYLRSNLPVMDVFFTGREREIAEIHEALSQQNVVLLSGVGGIGKSELARHYAMQYSSCYDAVVFAHYQKPAESDPESGILRMLTSDQEVPVANFRRFDGENNAEYFERKLKMLGDLCSDSGERVLFILDNMDTMDDGDLEKLMRIGCRMIVTTRCDLNEFYTQIDVDTIENVRDIFRHYYTNKMDEEQLKAEAEILEYFDHHTLGVELAARSLVSGRKKPTELLEMLRQKGASQSGKEKVRVKKDAALSNATMFEHIRMLFDVSGLTEDEKYVMANMSLLPVSGMPEEDLYHFCQLDSYNEINSLKDNGWLRRFPGVDSSKDGEVDFIALHPLVAEAAMELLKEKPERADSLLLELGGLIDSFEYRDSNLSEKGASADYCIGIADRVRISDICTEAAAYYLSRQPNSIIYGVTNKANILRAAQIFEKIKDSKVSKRLIDIADAINYADANISRGCYNFTRERLRYSIELYGENSARTAYAYCDYADCIGEFREYDAEVAEERAEAYDKALEILSKQDDGAYEYYQTLHTKILSCYCREERIEKLKALAERCKNKMALFWICRSLLEYVDRNSKEYKKYYRLMRYGEDREVDISERWESMDDFKRGDYYYYEQEEYDKALAYYENAFETNGHNMECFQPYQISNYADICFMQGNLNKAMKLLDLWACSSIPKLGEKHNFIAQSFEIVADWYQMHKMYDRALEYYGRGLKIHSDIHNNRGIVDVLGKLAEIYGSMKEYEKAVGYYSQMKQYLKTEGLLEGIRKTSHSISKIYCDAGRYEDAIESCYNDFDYLFEKGEYSGACDIIYNIEHIYTDNGRVADGLDCLKSVLKKFECIGIREQCANIIKHIAGIYVETGENENAITWYMKSIDIYSEFNARRDIASTSKAIAVLYYTIHKNEDALDWFHKTFNFYIELDDHMGMIEMSLVIGRIYHIMHEYEQALEWNKKTLDLEASADDMNTQYLAHYGIGAAYRNLGNIERALENLHKADDLCRECTRGYGKIYAGHLCEIAKVYYSIGKNDDAIAAHEKMAQMYREECESDPDMLAYGLYHAALSCRKDEQHWYNPEYAEKYLREAYECYTKNNIICDDFFDCVNVLADLLLNLKRYDEAEQLMLQWVEQIPKNHELRSTLSELYDAIEKPELAEKYRITE